MQINVALDDDNIEQAAKIRNVNYPNTSAKQTRDAFIFNQSIDGFNDDINVLLDYVERDKTRDTVQRMVTIKAESNERLKTIAASLNISIAATFRSIIAYTIDHLNITDSENSENINNAVFNKQLLKEKVALLETQIADCCKTLDAVKKLLN